ncbi:Crp/Fnr family transcriptional regulator [Lujinxingia vulgaris]|uniref:Crp/Fnr family transcriptional regulator n=1 Tax=Lujinxingia vulgaris TaxID=2600176 RepID=A0A5C6XE81_9DELT|nr:Crp/Fnr family transcriptional regulator [Lujinxingia vulgaris]TXD35685.1 Crp/Fnr family transcriptional regulator [Lujinxingia vulgaris]
MEKLKILREFSLFENIPTAALEPLASYFIPRRFERGERLWREGNEALSFVFVVEGQVKIVKYRNDGGETILGVFGADEVVGHLAVYRQIPYPASAYALEDTLTLQIHRSHFFGTIRDHSALMEALLQDMMQRNQELVGRLHDLSVSDTEQRLALLFMKFAESVGRRVAQESGEMGVVVELPLSRAEIACLINVRVETAIRFMSKWGKEGLVRTDGGGFTILDYERLSALARAMG